MIVFALFFCLCSNKFRLKNLLRIQSTALLIQFIRLHGQTETVSDATRATATEIGWWPVPFCYLLRQQTIE